MGGKLPGVHAPHVHGMVEHWGEQNVEDTPTHQWFGIDKPTTRGQHGGVGAYVSNKLSPFTQILPEFSNHNIMWLRIITQNQPLFIAITYAPPKNEEILTEIATNITETKANLEQVGKVLIMGDFNCRLGKLTRDKARDSTRANILKSMFKATTLSPLTNQQPDHWTCYTHNGQSVNDLFLVDKKEHRNCKDYLVHSKISFASDHRLLGFRWHTTLNMPEAGVWTLPNQTSIDWDDEDTCTDYLAALTPKLLEWSAVSQNLTEVARSVKATSKLVTALQQSLLHIQKRRGAPISNTRPESDKDIDALRTQRNTKIAEFNQAQREESRLTLLNSIEALQHRISSKLSTKEQVKTRKLWDKVLEKKNNKDLSSYWKMIKRIRKSNNSRLPTVMKNLEGDNVTKKEEILNVFSARYQHVFAGTDNEASQYQNFLHQNSREQTTSSTRRGISEKYKEVLKDINAEHAPSTSSLLADSALTLKETESAINGFKRHKAPGQTLITSEALQNGGPLLAVCLHSLFASWWSLGITPKSMQVALITPIFKKGDVTLPENYRPIALLNSLFKTYEKVLEKRLRKFAEDGKLLSPLQLGGRAKTGATEAIFQLLTAVHHRLEHSLPIYLTLLDLSKAYDRVWRKGLWVKLHSLGLNGCLLRALHSTYSDSTFTVKIGGDHSEGLPCPNGLRQGSVLSPLLFILLFSAVAEELDPSRGVQMPGDVLDLLHSQMFVDDTMFLTTTDTDILVQFKLFNQFAAVWGSVLNIEKTAVLSNKPLQASTEWLQDLNLTEAPKTVAKYLGVWISLKNLTWNQHFDKAISKARKSFFYLHAKGLKQGHIEPREAIELFKILILPQLTFGIEVLLPSDPVIQKVNNFIGFALKLMLGIPLTAQSETVMWEANIPDFSLMCELARLRFHRKMVVDPTSSPVSRYYKQGNYLFDANTLLLERWDYALSSHNSQWRTLFNTPLKPSKGAWSFLLKRALGLKRQDLLRSNCPLFFQMKPTENLFHQLFKLPTLSLSPLLCARHNVDLGTTCSCDKSIVSSSSVHLLTECLQPDVTASRIRLFHTLQQETTQSLLSLSDFELHDILVGQPSPLFSSSCSTKFLGLVALHLSNFTPTAVIQFRRKIHKKQN